jgi:hypothetical protein
MSEHAASTVVAQYLSALAGSDLDRARVLLADGFTFRGPGMERAVDRDAFLSEFGAKYDHVDDLRILRRAERQGQGRLAVRARRPHTARGRDVPDDGVEHGA